MSTRKYTKLKPKGYYTMAELKKMKEEKKKKEEAARKKARNTRIIKAAQSKQTKRNKPTAGSNIPITTTPAAKKPTAKKPRATRKKTTGVAVTRRGVSIKPITAPSGAKITKRATTKTTKQKNAARKAADIRQKGVDAMKAGKLGKARRLARRYQNKKKKM